MSAEKIRVIIVGSRGRMGETLMRLAGESPALELIAGVDREDNVLEAIDQADVLVEFAYHTLTPWLAQTAVEHGKALVIGTTGHTDGERAAIAAAAREIAIVFAPNFSVGVNLLFHLTRIAAKTLGADYDREIVEMHHRHKLDAPSGTARRLGEILAESAGGTYDAMALHGRHGNIGARPPNVIGMHAVRGGDVVGDHTVHFAADGERMELTHRASSRETFASGALRAAQWVVRQGPGLYSMQDVLGLE
jgi:4-hydroxy-tetrahydrodipicolinate reductase